MRAIDRYVLRQLLVGLVFITLGLTGILWLTQSLRFVELAVDKGASIAEFLELTLLILPNFLTVILPVALFAVILFVYNRLNSDGELVALRAAGLSHWRLSRPALILATGLAVLCLVLNFWVIPSSVAKFHVLQWSIRSNAVKVLLQSGSFNEITPGVTIYIRARGPGGEMLGLMVDDNRTPGHEVTLLAERGALVIEPDGRAEVAMVNGTRDEVTADSDRLSVLYFDNYAMELSIASGGDLESQTDPRQQTMGQLFAASPGVVGDSLYRQYRVEAHQRIVSPLYDFTFALLAATSLLIGHFNRRGQADRLGIAIAVMVSVQAMALGISDLAARNLALIPLIYLGPVLPAIAASWVLTRSAWNDGGGLVRLARALTG